MSIRLTPTLSFRKGIVISALAIASFLEANSIKTTNAATLDVDLAQSVIETAASTSPLGPREATPARQVVTDKATDEQAASSISELNDAPTPSSDSSISKFDIDRSAPQSSEATLIPPIAEDVDGRRLEEQCIDSYLWTFYQRTPKEDSIRVRSQIRVAIKRKGKTVNVIRTVSKSVSENFAWKDPKAAERFGKPMADYVIGGMESAFKTRLANLLRAAEQAGFSPGITSAFRDDYRQSIASGMKAAINRSYHGGTLRGGYGHGLAADLVSVAGKTRSERIASTQSFWKWIDANENEFGIGRPYLDRDPPHVGPTDGKEFADHRPAFPKRELSSAPKLNAKADSKGVDIASKETRS